MNTIESDIVIVGGGPAGISAACCAAENGQRVVLLDANPSLGGQIWRGVKAPGDPKTAGPLMWLTRFSKSGAQHLAGREVIGLMGFMNMNRICDRGYVAAYEFQRIASCIRLLLLDG